MPGSTDVSENIKKLKGQSSKRRPHKQVVASAISQAQEAKKKKKR